MRIFVVGGLSYIGRHLIPELTRLEHQVAYSCRDMLRPAPWQSDLAQRYHLDLVNSHGWESALEEIELIFYLAHGMASDANLIAREQAMATRLAKCAKNAGVKRIIYLGSLSSEHPDSVHIQARLATSEALKKSGIPVTEVRSGVVIGSGSAAFEVMRDMAAHLPVMTVPRWGNNFSPPIALDNLLHYLCRLAEIPETAGNCYDIAGPRWISYIDLLKLVAQAIGRKPLIIKVPLLPVWLATWWTKLITSVPSPLAKQLVLGLNESLRADPSAIRRLIPQRLVSPEQAVCDALTREQIIRQPKAWEHGVPVFRRFSSRHAWYAKHVSYTATVYADARAIWDVLCLLGGKNGYFYGKWLWFIREQLDHLMGGNGHIHRRTDPQQLNQGDWIDSWQVLTAEAPELLVLRFGMKAPGGGGMQFRIEQKGEQCCELSLSIHWHPAGIWGLLYWFAMMPFHQLLLSGMVSGIATRAECARSL